MIKIFLWKTQENKLKNNKLPRTVIHYRINIHKSVIFIYKNNIHLEDVMKEEPIYNSNKKVQISRGKHLK